MRLGAMQLHRPRQWGALLAGLPVYEQLELDRFWAARLPDSREGTRWSHILQTWRGLPADRSGSENGDCTARLCSSRAPWATSSARIFRWSRKNALYRPPTLLDHKAALFRICAALADLFAARFDVLLYDLTSTYFESDPPTTRSDKRRHATAATSAADCRPGGHRADFVTRRVFHSPTRSSGNTSDKTTLRAFLARIEAQYGTGAPDLGDGSGIPTEDALAGCARPIRPFLSGGEPQGRSTSWRRGSSACPGRPCGRVDVKLLAKRRALPCWPRAAPASTRSAAMRRRS